MKTFFAHSGIAVVVGLFLICAEIMHAPPKYWVFKQIEVGMPRPDLEHLLEQNGVHCVLSAPNGSYAQSSCDFEDYVREYHVSVDPKTNRVSLVLFDFHYGSRGEY